MTNDYTTRRKELEFQNLQALCLKFLGSPLVEDTDYELTQDGEYYTYKTEDDMFFFVPQLDDPVMSERTLTGQKPIEGRYRYSIEVIQGDGGSYWEPPDYDQVEIGREDSLEKAIAFAAHYLLDIQLNGESEGLYWNMESTLEKECPDDGLTNYVKGVKSIKNESGIRIPL